MKLVKLLFVIIAGLVVTSITYSNHSLDDSQLVSDLSSDIVKLEKDNTVLKAEIADAGSLTKLNERIATLGFVESPKIVSLSAPAAVASR